MNINLIAFVLFSAGVIYYMAKNRKEFEADGIIFVQRTKFGIKLLTQIHKSNPEFWKQTSRAFVFISLAGMAFMSIYITSLAAMSIKTGVSGLKLVLPSATGGFSSKPGILFIPLWLWIVAIMLIAFPHEAMHGIVALSEKVRLKNTGLAFLLVIPGAFVEADERQMKGVRKLKIASAGPAANILTGIILLLIVAAATSVLFVPSGIDFSSLRNNTDAFHKNLSGTILSINNQTIRSIHDLEVFLKKTNSSQFEITTTNGTYEITPFRENGRLFIGINNVRTHYEFRPGRGKEIASAILFYLMWLSMLTIGVGLANLLPVMPFDGGHIVDVLIKSRKMKKAITIATWVVIAISFAVPIVRHFLL